MSRFVWVLTFVFSTTAFAEKRGVAVLDITGQGVDPQLIPILTEILTVEIDNLGMYKVIGGRDVQAMLGFEKQKDIAGCTDAACLAEIGGALGVDRIVASHIGKVGKTYVVNIKLINIRMADTEARVYETVRGEDDALITTIKKSVEKLLGKKSKAGSAVAAATPKVEPKPAAEPKVKPKPKVEPKDEPKEEPTEVAAVTPVEEIPTVETSGGSSIGWLPITLWGVGGVAVGVGVIFGLNASKHEETANERMPDSDVYAVGAQVAVGDAESAATMSTIFYIVGGAAVGGGFLALLLGGDDAPATAFVPVVGRDTVGFAWSGQF